MTKKSTEDMFNDPIPNSYPEEQDEVFESMQEAGMKPEDIRGSLADEYKFWLKKREIFKSKTIRDDGEEK